MFWRAISNNSIAPSIFLKEFLNFYHRYNEEDNLCSHPRTGGPRKTTAIQDAQILQASAENSKLTAAQISRILGKN